MNSMPTIAILFATVGCLLSIPSLNASEPVAGEVAQIEPTELLEPQTANHPTEEVPQSSGNDEPEGDSNEQTTPSAGDSVAAAQQPDLPTDPTWKPIAEQGLIWVDMKRKAVIVAGKVCLREGPLEMFACPPNTKEYESVLVVNCPAFVVHAGLLAVGAEPGSPVTFDPYKGASGPVIDVFVEWLDAEGNKLKARAQDWIRHDKTGKPMEHDFVFGGSGFWTDEDTGAQNYYAEGGELICVSNFSTATMDLPVRSPQDNSGLWFSAFSDKIPKLGTKVHLILIPRLEKNAVVKP